MRSLFNSLNSHIAKSLILLQCAFTVIPAGAATLQGHVEESGSQTLSAQAEVQESFPTTYEGSWHCVTTVTDSAIPEVTPGTVTQCDIQFKRSKDGRILARWTQPGWTESQSSVVAFSKTEARLDRTAYFWADGAGGAWATRSRDNFTLTANNAIISNSYVDQYIDGQYLGRYKTNSVLTKIDVPLTTAMLLK